jgi:hypothetical protein
MLQHSYSAFSIDKQIQAYQVRKVNASGPRTYIKEILRQAWIKSGRTEPSNKPPSHLFPIARKLSHRSHENRSPNMFDIIREAPLGMIINRLTGDRVFRHPEDAPGFEWTPRSLKFVEKRIPTQSVDDESLAVTPASTKSETIVDPTDVLDQLDPLTVVDWYDDQDPNDP